MSDPLLMDVGTKPRRVHELKTLPIYWDAVARGEKLFEVRKNDRFFQAGDEVALQRFGECPGFYGTSYLKANDWRCGIAEAATLRFIIGPVLQGGQFGIEPGFCVFSLLPLPGATP